jgi:hypothetical protein
VVSPLCPLKKLKVYFLSVSLQKSGYFFEKLGKLCIFSKIDVYFFYSLKKKKKGQKRDGYKDNTNSK